MEYNVIGKIYTQPEYDSEGNPLTQPELVTYEGREWHVNARGEVPSEWEAFEVFPSGTPKRVYQGGGTRFFVFESEGQFEGLLPQESSTSY